MLYFGVCSPPSPNWMADTFLINISFGAYDPTPHGPIVFLNFKNLLHQFIILKNHFLANHAFKASNFETIVIVDIIKSI
jgi:hypothetical protein